MNARCFPGLLVVVAFLSGCEEEVGKRNHAQQPPQLPAIVGSLRAAKDELEQYGCMAKNQISHGLLGRNTDGQTSYIDAQKRHNACIQYIGTGLDSDSGLDGVALRGCLSDADQYRVKLTTWCHEHKLKGRVFGKRAPGEAHIPGEVTARAPAAGAEIAADFLIGALHELLDYDVKLKELDQKVRAAQIERIKKELKACECKQWSQL